MNGDAWGQPRRRPRTRDRVPQALRALAADVRRLYGDSAPEIVLYGSQARGRAHSESDVDVLLLFRDPVHASTEIRRISPLLADLNLEYGVLISVVPTDVGAYERAEGAFWTNVRREGVHIGAA